MTRSARAPGPLALSALLALGAAPARADEAEGARAQAANYFDAGAQAYDAGKYLAAAEAFMKAHALVPSPSLLFSAAQAYRRQYLADPAPDTLRRAVSLYREYLKVDPAGRRRDEAMKALEALAPIEARLAPPEAAPAAAKRPARILLTAPPAGAQASIDGGAFVAIPHEAEVAPGPHVVRVRAPGHVEEQVTVVAVASDLVARHVPLRPKPAKLVIRGTSGARVEIDGRARALVPTEAPLSLEPGAHFISVTLAGHKPWGQTMDFRPDQSTELTLELPQTSQRVAAWAVLSAGAAGAVASGVLAGLAIARQSEASDLRDKLESSGLTPAERDRYNDAAAARDDLALASGLVGGFAALTIGAGAGLFAFDDAQVLPPGDARPAAQPGAHTEVTLGFLSLGVRGRF
ncbi:MAG: PEGA domain-containing protein [Polyangiaceae bacterium]|nr:PEGA domain-containing protein [Polyangiaceae bacterium]